MSIDPGEIEKDNTRSNRRELAGDSALLKGLREEALEAIEKAASSTELESIRVRYLGKKGTLTIQMKGLGRLPAEQRPLVGAAVNDAKMAVESAIERKLTVQKREERTGALATESFDITLPGRPTPMGKVHPVNQVFEQLIDIFAGLGFMVAEGPEIETDHYNFKMLNFPDDHPARDMQDTFYVFDGAKLLRTHTSPVQIHAMQKYAPPLSIIAPGRVFRCDSDITHSPVFHQLEGFHIDTDVHMGHLKGALELFAHRLYGPETAIRLRPSFFPFTEPSAELDVSCQICQGDGCRVCKRTGWMEILGAGMIDPNVLEGVGIDPDIWSGFAFGLGVERIAMLKYGIDDIRYLFDNDTRFLEQF